MLVVPSASREPNLFTDYPILPGTYDELIHLGRAPIAGPAPSSSARSTGSRR